jgi:lipoprotein-anchoring transpeptidase ErfK/SrfK
MDEMKVRRLALVALLVLALPWWAHAADEQPQRFDFPPEIVAAEEAAAAEPAAASSESAPAKPLPRGGQGQPAAATAAAPAPLVTPQAAVRQMVFDLREEGVSSVDEIVDRIVNERDAALDHIVINIATQHIYECNASGEVLHEDKVSTGRPGFDTPPGNYTVHNKSPKAYSQKYTAWMLQWMAITGDGSYGMHGLEGSSYEKHLGHQASHGCIRISRKYAKDLYPRVKVGMPVKVVNDKQLELPGFQPMNADEVRALVIEALSPADPAQLFF